VIVAFTTSWCNHCKEIEKLFKGVKKRLYKHIGDFVFARIDIQKNELGI